MEEEISENESKLKNAREKVETQLANKEITQEEADEKLNRIVEDEKKVSEMKVKLAEEKVKVKQLNTPVEGN